MSKAYEGGGPLEEYTFDLQIGISIPEDKKISIGSITKAIEESDLNKQVFKQILEAIQEQEVLRLCGEKNRKNETKPCKRAGCSNKTIGTKLGKIQIALRKVRDKITNDIFKPLKERIDLKDKKIYQDDISILSVEFASKMTYRDANREGKRITEEFPSAHTINRRAREYGEEIIQFNESETNEQYNIIMADGTKVHGLHKRKNEVNAIIALDKNGNKRLLSASVNRSWYCIAKDVRKRISDNATLISDAEKEIRYALLQKDMHFQLDIVHAAREVGYKLWQDQIPREERKVILTELQTLLYTLKNSVEKHALDGDMERLKQRAETTLQGLKDLAKKVARLGCWRAAKFIRASANYMLTYALLLIKGIDIPWNSNIIERLMGEIAKRVKNKWMHWSAPGLEAIINLILVRYTNEATYEKFYHQVQGTDSSKFINIEVKICSVITYWKTQV